MATERLRVVLTMEESLLSSAMAQFLADNPRLDVMVHPPLAEDVAPAASPPTDIARTVRIGLLDDPVRFALEADGRQWLLEYRSLAGLARVLADLERADVASIDRA